MQVRENVLVVLNNIYSVLLISVKKRNFPNQNFSLPISSILFKDPQFDDDYIFKATLIPTAV